LISGGEDGDSLIGVVELAESTNQFYEFTRLKKDQSTIAVMVREGAEGFVAK